MNSLLNFIYYLSSHKLTLMQINRITGIKPFLLIIMLTFSFVVHGIDTLYNKASFQNNTDSAKIMLLKKEALRFFNSDNSYSLLIIDEILKLPKSDLSESQQANISKLAAYSYLNSPYKEKALSLLHSAELNYAALQNNINLAFIYNMYFMYYIQESKDDSVIFYYQKALATLRKQSDKTTKSYNSTISVINTNIGNFFYFNRENPNEAKIYFDSALYYAEQINDSMRIAASLSNIGMVYNSANEYEKAKDNYSKAYKMSIALGNKIYAANILANIGDVYVKQGIIDNGIEYKLKAFKMFKETGNSFLIFKSERILAKEYLNNNMTTLAKPHLLNLINDTLSIPLDEQLSLFSALTELYKKLQNTDSALYYHEIYSGLSMSLQKRKNFKATEELIISHKTEQALKENQLLSIRYKVQQKRHYQLIIVAIVMFIIILLLFFIIYQRRKLQIAKRKEIEIENKFLKEKLEFKTKELTITTMNIIRHSEFVSSLVPDLKELYKSANTRDKALIASIVQKINIHNKTELWDDFYKTFTEVNGSFFEVLNERYPKLGVKERKLCALLKLEMSTKDIASITNTSTRGVETARLRLRKKLDLSTEDNLCIFLRQIG